MKTLLASPSLATRAVPQLRPRAQAAIGHTGRRLLAAGTLAVAGLSLHSGGAVAQADAWMNDTWTGTWAAMPNGAALPVQPLTLSGQTLRLIVRASIGGSRVRIRLSNASGTAPLHLGSVHIARRQNGAIIMAATDRALRFSGAEEVTIAAGETVLSDPVPLDVPELADLAVSLYLPGQVQANTGHAAGFETNYVSLPGNFAAAQVLPTDHTITSWPFLAEVDVDAPASRTAVALGGARARFE